MPTPNDQLPGNDPELTEAERAAAGEMDDEGNLVEKQPEAEAAAPAEPETAPPAAADEPPADPPPPVALTPQPGPVAFPQITPGAPRDFTAELTSLKERFSNGDIDDDAYESERDAIIVARASAETMAQVQSQLAEQSWQANIKAFLMLPENAAILRSPDMQAHFQSAMQLAVNDAAAAGTPLADDWQMLKAGRDRLFATMGLSASAPPAPPPPQPPRAPKLDNLPPTLSGAPAASPSGARQTAAELAESGDIMELERAMAGMTEAQQDELLRGVPGAFVD